MSSDDEAGRRGDGVWQVVPDMGMQPTLAPEKYIIELSISNAVMHANILPILSIKMVMRQN